MCATSPVLNTLNMLALRSTCAVDFVVTIFTNYLLIYLPISCQFKYLTRKIVISGNYEHVAIMN